MNGIRTASLKVGVYFFYLPEIADNKQEIWDKIFRKTEGKAKSYIEIRNNLVHTGSDYSHKSKDITIELINDATLDIAKFVYYLDNKIFSNYPMLKNITANYLK